MTEIKAFQVRWPVELVARIDRVRGDVPRTVWLRRLVERELGEDRSVVSAEVFAAPIVERQQVRAPVSVVRSGAVLPGFDEAAMRRQQALNKAKGL